MELSTLFVAVRVKKDDFGQDMKDVKAELEAVEKAGINLSVNVDDATLRAALTKAKAELRAELETSLRTQGRTLSKSGGNTGSSKADLTAQSEYLKAVAKYYEDMKAYFVDNGNVMASLDGAIRELNSMLVNIQSRLGMLPSETSGASGYDESHYPTLEKMYGRKIHYAPGKTDSGGTEHGTEISEMLQGAPRSVRQYFKRVKGRHDTDNSNQVDTVAAEMGFSSVDDFLNALTSEARASSAAKKVSRMGGGAGGGSGAIFGGGLGGGSTPILEAMLGVLQDIKSMIGRAAGKVSRVVGGVGRKLSNATKTPRVRKPRVKVGDEGQPIPENADTSFDFGVAETPKAVRAAAAPAPTGPLSLEDEPLSLEGGGASTPSKKASVWSRIVQQRARGTMPLPGGGKASAGAGLDLSRLGSSAGMGGIRTAAQRAVDKMVAMARTAVIDGMVRTLDEMHGTRSPEKLEKLRKHHDHLNRQLTYLNSLVEAQNNRISPAPHAAVAEEATVGMTAAHGAGGGVSRPRGFFGRLGYAARRGMAAMGGDGATAQAGGGGDHVNALTASSAIARFISQAMRLMPGRGGDPLYAAALAERSLGTFLRSRRKRGQQAYVTIGGRTRAPGIATGAGRFMMADAGTSAAIAGAGAPVMRGGGAAGGGIGTAASAILPRVMQVFAKLLPVLFVFVTAAILAGLALRMLGSSFMKAAASSPQLARGTEQAAIAMDGFQASAGMAIAEGIGLADAFKDFTDLANDKEFVDELAEAAHRTGTVLGVLAGILLLIGSAFMQVIDVIAFFIRAFQFVIGAILKAISKIPFMGGGMIENTADELMQRGGAGLDAAYNRTKQRWTGDNMGVKEIERSFANADKPASGRSKNTMAEGRNARNPQWGITGGTSFGAMPVGASAVGGMPGAHDVGGASGASAGVSAASVDPVDKLVQIATMQNGYLRTIANNTRDPSTRYS